MPRVKNQRLLFSKNALEHLNRSSGKTVDIPILKTCCLCSASKEKTTTTTTPPIKTLNK